MRLGEVLKSHRLMSRAGVREAAREVGISPATLSRIERGKPCDSGSFAKIMLWLIGSAR